MDNEDVLEIVTSYVDKPNESGIICFNLIQNESVDVKTFSNDKYKCDFSPIGYSIFHENSDEIIEMEIAYNDEKKLYFNILIRILEMAKKVLTMW